MFFNVFICTIIQRYKSSMMEMATHPILLFVWIWRGGEGEGEVVNLKLDLLKELQDLWTMTVVMIIK